MSLVTSSFGSAMSPLLSPVIPTPTWSSNIKDFLFYSRCVNGRHIHDGNLDNLLRLLTEYQLIKIFREVWPISRERRQPTRQIAVRTDPQVTSVKRATGGKCWRATRRGTRRWRGDAARSSREFVSWNVHCRLCWWASLRLPPVANEGSRISRRKIPRICPDLRRKRS